MSFTFDYMLVGSTGQIGRYLAVYLKAKGRTFIVTRAMMSSRDIVLPEARHVINAGGYTKFDGNTNRYWHDNIRLAVKLAQHAKDTGADYHQFSSEAVAEYRQSPLRETIVGTVAHPRMIDYALSKVLMEQAVSSIIHDKLHLYRCCDIVPPWGNMAKEWRRNHWLAILFAAGKHGFKDDDDFPVWIAPVDELVRAFMLLMTYEGPGAYHLLGHRYRWHEFHKAAEDRDKRASSAVRRVSEVVRIDPPLAECIYADRTEEILRAQDFVWTKLPHRYWTEFAKYAVKEAQ